MDDRLEKILRLWRSKTHDGEKASARGIAERLLRGSGLSFDDAVAALDGPSPRPRAPRETPEQAKERCHREKWRADIAAAYGGLDAARAPTAAEQAILAALEKYTVASPYTGRTI